MDESRVREIVREELLKGRPSPVSIKAFRKWWQAAMYSAPEFRDLLSADLRPSNNIERKP